MTTDTTEKLVPVTAYVPEKVKRNVKVLAAQWGSTMDKVTREAFDIGLKALQERQRREEEVEAGLVEEEERGRQAS